MSLAYVRPATAQITIGARQSLPHELDHRQPPLHREAQVLGQLLRPMPPARRTAIPRKRIARCEAALFHFTKGAWSTSKIRAGAPMRMRTGTTSTEPSPSGGTRVLSATMVGQGSPTKCRLGTG